MPLTAEDVRDWRDAGRKKMLDALHGGFKGTTGPAGKDVPHVHADLATLLRGVTQGDVEVQQGVDLLVEAAKDCDAPAAADAIAHACWIVAFEVQFTVDEYAASAEWRRLAQFASAAASGATPVAPRDVLLTTLPDDLVGAARLVGSQRQFQRLRTRRTTRLRFTQTKYSLLHEESEGFAKVAAELNGPLPTGPAAGSVLQQRLTALVGRFSLDPNRTVDLVLEACERRPGEPALLDALRLHNTARVPHILGFKLARYHARAQEALRRASERRGEGDPPPPPLRTPPSLLDVAARLTAAGLLDPVALMPHMGPDDAAAAEHAAAVAACLSHTTRHIGARSLGGGDARAGMPGGASVGTLGSESAGATQVAAAALASVDAEEWMTAHRKGGEGESGAEGEGIWRDEVARLPNQKAAFVAALVRRGAWRAAVRVMEHLGALGVDVVSGDAGVRAALIEAVEGVIAPAYRAVDPLAALAPPSPAAEQSGAAGGMEEEEDEDEGGGAAGQASNGATGSEEEEEEEEGEEGVESEFGRAPTGEEDVSPRADAAGALRACVPYLRALGPWLSDAPALYSRLCRLLARALQEGAGAWEDAGSDVRRTTDAVLAALVTALPLLGTGGSGAHELWSALRQLPYEARYALYAAWRDRGYRCHPLLRHEWSCMVHETKQVSKRLAEESVEQVCRRMAKLAHGNPVPVLEEVVGKLELYDNLVKLAVRAVRLVSPLALDVLSWLVVDRLSLPRDTVRDGGIHLAKWLNALSAFAGELYREMPSVELAGTLQCVAARLLQQQPAVVEVLASLLRSMGDEGASEHFSTQQLEAAVAGPLLRRLALPHATASLEAVVAATSARSARTREFAVSKLRDALLGRSAGSHGTLPSGAGAAHGAAARPEGLAERRRRLAVAVPLLVLLAQAREDLAYQARGMPPRLLGVRLDRCTLAFTQFVSFLSRNVSSPRALGALLPSPRELCGPMAVPPDAALYACSRVMRAAWDQHHATEEGGSGAEAAAWWRGWSPEGEALAAAVRSVDALEPLWAHMTPRFYLLFWALGLGDVGTAEASYQSKQQTVKAAVDLARQAASHSSSEARARDRAVREARGVLQRLGEEQKEQVARVETVRKRVAAARETLLAGAAAEGGQEGGVEERATLIVQEMVLPRVQLSPSDALFAARFLLAVHAADVVGFSLPAVVDVVVRRAAHATRCWTEQEVTNLAAFLSELFPALWTWSQSQSKFARACASSWGFRAAGVSEHSKWTQLLQKWLRKLTRTALASLREEEPVRVRNTLVLVLHSSAAFPRFAEDAELLARRAEEATRRAKERNQEDLQKLASRLAQTSELAASRLPRLTPKPEAKAADSGAQGAGAATGNRKRGRDGNGRERSSGRRTLTSGQEEEGGSSSRGRGNGSRSGATSETAPRKRARPSASERDSGEAAVGGRRDSERERPREREREREEKGQGAAGQGASTEEAGGRTSSRRRAARGDDAREGGSGDRRSGGEDAAKAAKTGDGKEKGGESGAAADKDKETSAKAGSAKAGSAKAGSAKAGSAKAGSAKAGSAKAGKGGEEQGKETRTRARREEGPPPRKVRGRGGVAAPVGAGATPPAPETAQPPAHEPATPSEGGGEAGQGGQEGARRRRNKGGRRGARGGRGGGEAEGGGGGRGGRSGGRSDQRRRR